MNRWLIAVVLALLLVGAAACGGDDDAGRGETLTIYSGREEEIVEPLFATFEKETGVSVEVRYGDSAELAAPLAEEGKNSPADIFFAQDAGALGAEGEESRLAPLPDDVLELVARTTRSATAAGSARPAASGSSRTTPRP